MSNARQGKETDSFWPKGNIKVRKANITIMKSWSFVWKRNVQVECERSNFFVDGLASVVILLLCRGMISEQMKMQLSFNNANGGKRSI